MRISPRASKTRQQRTVACSSISAAIGVPDCIVLDHHFHAAENAALLQKHYVLVHVNIGDKGITDNFAIAERFGIPLEKGVPALAVLDPDGRVVFAQKQGEFEAMRKLDPASVRTFLMKWAR
jgi:hypothetical protein